MRKNVLFFTYDFPYPTTSGGKIRAHNLIRFGLKNHNVHLFSFTREDISEKRKQALKDIGVKSITLFPRRKVFDPRNISLFSNDSVFKKLYWSQKIDQILFDYLQENNIDVLFCESFYTGFYLSGKAKGLNIKKIFGTENIEYQIYQDYIKQNKLGILKNVLTREVEKIRSEEVLALKSADLTLAVSEAEQKMLLDLDKSSQVKVVENGVDLKTFSYSWVKRNTKNLLFVGNFSYFPNRAAIKYFYDEVFKKMTDVDLRLRIIGKDSDRLKIRDMRLTTVSYVDDIHKEYANADVFVFPVKLGGGSNFKVIEAMASGVPVVGFKDRLEGISVIEDVHYLKANDASSFKEAINNVLSDEDLANKVSRNARLHMEKHFEWSKIGEKLDNLLLSL